MKRIVLIPLLVAAMASAEPTRVENRLLVKEQRVFATAGAAWLARGDYYDSPAVVVNAAFYPWESGGVELKLGLFFSSLNASAREVLERANVLPDASRPLGFALVGWRQTVGYGKVAVGTSGPRIVHFDLQLAAHGGVLVGERGVAPGIGAGPGLLIRWNDSIFAQLDVPLLGSYERRLKGSFPVGLMPALSIGISP